MIPVLEAEPRLFFINGLLNLGPQNAPHEGRMMLPIGKHSVGYRADPSLTSNPEIGPSARQRFSRFPTLMMT